MTNILIILVMGSLVAFACAADSDNSKMSINQQTETITVDGTKCIIYRDLDGVGLSCDFKSTKQ